MLNVTDTAAAAVKVAPVAMVVYLYFGEVIMANKYYDSEFSGAQIDAAVRASTAVAEVSKPVNAGKVLAISNEGKLVAVELAEILENGDVVQY